MKEHDCDVLIVGSGAAGLAAAITARKSGLDALILEKEAVFGGTSARSGGYLWIPGNRHVREESPIDIAAARLYLAHEVGNHLDAARIDAFLRRGPEMVEFFERETEMRFQASPAFADYHPEVEGASQGGRSILAEPYDGRKLGHEIRRLRPPLKEITFVGMLLSSSQEVRHFFNATRSLSSLLYVLKRLTQHGFELLRYGRAMRLTNGSALIGRLACSAFDQGIPIWTSTPARELLVENGKVIGVIAEQEGGEIRISTRRGVVLAAGGFPHDIARRARNFRHAPNGRAHYSPAADGNTGDGITLAERIGASVDETLPNAAAWIPVSLVPYGRGRVGIFPHLIDRPKPGVIAVAPNGRRFVNEANSYHDFVQALVRANAGAADIFAWLIADHRAIRRYGLGIVKPFPIPMRRWIKSGYLLRGHTLGELAARCGIDPKCLQRTVENFNRHAALGEDPEFRKGKNAYNRFLGDSAHTPNPCVAPLSTPPYYAIKLVIGDLGTFAGLRTDEYARVLDSSKNPIPGLYAVGNDAASVMGGAYPAGGITLGPAMTFGYIAGRHLAENAAVP